MAATNLNYHIDQNANCTTVTLLPGLNDAQWSDIEKAGTEIASRLNGLRSPAVTVDLTPLTYMGSSMVAMIVRCWKNVQSNNGRLVVVCNNDVVREVISLAGLSKVWTIVETREAALREFGLTGAGGGGGDRWFVIAGVAAVLAGIVGAGLLLSQTGGSEVASGLLFGGAGVGFIVGLVTLMRSTSSSRNWGLGVVLAAVAVAVLGFVNMNRGGQAAPQVPAAEAEPATENAPAEETEPPAEEKPQAEAAAAPEEDT